MLKLRSTEDTICALTTPPGYGGVGMIRVSGAQALSICRNLMKLPDEPESHRAYFTTLKNPKTSAPIDEALVTYFAEGKSYTGDQTLEVSCHGSPAVAEEIIQCLLQAGCRHAERGEFTFRAFMSGKIDLVQAESVLSLVESETKKAAEASLRQLKGELSKKLKIIKEKTLYLLAHLEAGIDFSQEGLETITQQKVLEEVLEIKNQTEELSASYEEGKILTDNFTIALVGAPNVGKSSLFNLFLKSDRAIVTEVAGTTRDALEGTIVISGIKVKFVDTAGLRETKDIVEKLGIQKTKEQTEQANLIFYVIDGTQAQHDLDLDLLNRYKDKTVLIANKADLSNFNQNFKETFPKTLDNKSFAVSAKQAESLAQILQFLEDKLKQTFHESSAIVLKARQFELLNQASTCLSRAEKLCQDEASQEFTAFELRDALELIMEVLGEKFDDQVLEKVFKEFCIGK